MKIVVSFSRAPSHYVRTKIYQEKGYILWSSPFFKIEGRLSRIMGYVHLLSIFFLRKKEIEKIVFIKPHNPNFIKLIANLKLDIQYDIDDAIWGENWMGKHKTDQLFKFPKHVFCDNLYLQQFIRRNYGISTSILHGYLPKFNQKFKHNSSGDNIINIGWIGSRSTAYNLYKIGEDLIKLDSDPLFRIYFLGIEKKDLGHLDLDNSIFIPNYNEEIMIKYLYVFNIGLFPMYNVLNNWGRGYHKLRIYRNFDCETFLSKIDFFEENYEEDKSIHALSENQSFYKEIVKWSKS